MRKLKKIAIVISFVVMATFLFAFKTDYFEVAKQIEIYTTLFKELNMYYIDEINPGDLTDKAINNMLNDLDPYTKFYDEQSVEEVKINSLGEYSGIGAQSKFTNNKLLVFEIYQGLPAEKAGMKVGDEILKIDDLAVDSYEDMEVLTLLKGSPDTMVKLTINRQGQILNFEMNREKISINPVPHFQMIDQEIGYIAFDKFNEKATSSVLAAFNDLKTQGMTKLILDVRGNPGGLLNEAISITNLFVPKNEVVVTTKAKLKKWSETYRTQNDPVDLEIPIIVLIDGASASASEIVAGSLQDLDRAVILGERSFGKGLVQRYRDLTYGTKLKLTISKYYTPSGRNIQELDYSNREGRDVPKFSEVNRNAFKTKNGRTVYDGGGIEPDVKIEKPTATKSTSALFQSDAIFNFATIYNSKKPSISNPEEYVFGDKDYQDFILFLKEHKTLFKTETELQFATAFATAEKENMNKSIQDSYLNLLSQLQEEKIKELSPNKEEIKEQLSDEIINRYYFKKGEYQNHIYHNKSILEAVKILKDNNKYKQILNND